MALSFLESFDRPVAPPPPVEPELAYTAEDLAAARQEGHAEGYGSGWETASQEAREDQERIGAELARHLQDLGFTFQEARAHVMKGIEPLLREMLQTLLPAIMVDAVGHTILQEVLPIAEEASEVPVRLAVAPEDADRLRTIIGENTPVPMRIEEDPALKSGQADLRLGHVEKIIDLSGVLAHLTTSVQAVEELNQRTLAHA
jgi:flagellar assembly protein FliH